MIQATVRSPASGEQGGQTEDEGMDEAKYLRLLSQQYQNIAMAKGRIIELKALLDLPKGTEYFFSDLHGEDGAFIHLMRSGSGNIRTKIGELYGNVLTTEEQNRLANLIYDPEKIMHILEREGRYNEEWVRITIIRLAELCRYCSSKYPRETVDRQMPAAYRKIVRELLYAYDGDFDRNAFYNQIIAYIIETDCAGRFIQQLCSMIQRICVNYVHIIGDIFDRGKNPYRIMEELIDFDRVDFQWGNHDIEWMGAALGNEVCICSVLRANIAYNNFDALETGYSINLRSLSSFAQKVYGEDPCLRFRPRVLDENVYDLVDPDLAAKMHKAIAVIMFKLEGQLLERHPEWQMEHRKVLLKTDFARHCYRWQGKDYPLLDQNFPTIDPADPLRLSKEEEDLLFGLKASFRYSEPLRRHVDYLFSHGSTYKCCNGNLLFHGCIPMTEEGDFAPLELGGKSYRGRELMDFAAYMVSQAYYSARGGEENPDAVDFMWYLWCGEKSPMFGKSQISTFENYFVGDKEVCQERYNPYFRHSQEEACCLRILEDFGLGGPHAHIINGHVPVKIKDGESPIKANGRLFVIDGGIAKAYQSKTGIAGYTLIFNSHHLALAEHHSFNQIESDMGSYTPRIRVVDVMPHRLCKRETDQGAEYMAEIQDLEALVEAYRSGVIKEQ